MAPRTVRRADNCASRASIAISLSEFFMTSLAKSSSQNPAIEEQYEHSEADCACRANRNARALALYCYRARQESAHGASGDCEHDREYALLELRRIWDKDCDRQQRHEADRARDGEPDE